MTHGRSISVIGLGYVGLPVAVAFSRLSKVVGFDINPNRILELERGFDNTNEVNKDDLLRADIVYSTEPETLKHADFHIVTVPTPIDQSKQPDLNPLIRASETVASILKQGDIIVYESTVYPGATEEVCLHVLENHSGLVAGKDFFIGYSPERINPGDKEHTFTRIKKVVSAQQPHILEIIAEVYGSVVTAGLHKAPSIKVAEAAKIIENTQRDINISLMNELALIFDRLNIDTGDVLEASGTKWNFLPFKPGLVGGHCIGVDPYYLTYKAEQIGYHPEIILAGRRINDEMGKHVASKVIKYMGKTGLTIKNARVTVLGFTFKQNVPDTRNTRVIDIVRSLQDYDIEVQLYDPVADSKVAEHEYGVKLNTLDELKPADAAILAVPHNEICQQGWELFRSLLNNGCGVVYDVHSVLERARVPDGITLLRM